MNISLHTNCLDMHRQAYRANIPLELYSQLSPETKAKLKKAYDESIRQYNISNYQLDPQFRNIYPAQAALSFGDLITNTPLSLTAVESPDVSTPPEETTILSRDLVPFMGDTVYVDPREADRKYETLLKQYKTPEDGEPPTLLTAEEYLYYLKNTNKELQLGISYLDGSIRKRAAVHNAQTAAAANEFAQRLKETIGDKTLPRDAPWLVLGAFVGLRNRIEESSVDLNRLYNNAYLYIDEDLEAERNAYLALGLAPTLRGNVLIVAEQKEHQGMPLADLEQVAISLERMTINEKIQFISQF